MLTQPLPADAGPDAEPQPCPHIDWETHSQYATWSVGPDGLTGEQFQQRLDDVQRQGLDFAGEPHLCFTDGDDVFVIAVALA